MHGALALRDRTHLESVGFGPPEARRRHVPPEHDLAEELVLPGALPTEDRRYLLQLLGLVVGQVFGLLVLRQDVIKISLCFFDILVYLPRYIFCNIGIARPVSEHSFGIGFAKFAKS